MEDLLFNGKLKNFEEKNKPHNSLNMPAQVDPDWIKKASKQPAQQLAPKWTQLQANTL